MPRFPLRAAAALMAAALLVSAAPSALLADDFATERAAVAEAVAAYEAVDLAGALRLAEPAAAAGNPVALHILGLVRLDPAGPAHDPAAGEAALRAALSAGYPDAGFELARALHEGRLGRPADPAAAVAVLAGVIARDPSYAPAYPALAALYAREETTEDFAALQAILPTGLALNPGHPGLLSIRGDAAFFGLAQPEDRAAALADYEAAAAAGHGYALLRLAEMYRFGDAPVAQDHVRARAYLRDAAARGEAGALSTLADMDYFGEGGPVDHPSAAAGFAAALAADPTDAFAAYSLGYMLMRGEGAAVDHPRAQALLEQASALGDIYGDLELIVLLAPHPDFTVAAPDPARAWGLCLRHAAYIAEDPEGVLDQTPEACAHLDATMSPETRAAGEALAAAD
ncbi:tetratricopeptide repeat protein [Roseicyclus persicicus]|uniref:Sel1 repeat family protein n=1 Tax=Roseicyclus persicicus TaxID=2650661 RepID=A0A7X6H3D6_9RHOB|nr:sel1 repeat family protein [Roseibacterium persicicum]NKX46418.1 sel1 repeat family protein [Roseibacterium persicicum]